MVSPQPTDPAGIVLVDKPSGITSFDVIRQLRRKTGIKKVGHAGTLDPLASGLMILLIGRATKQADRFLKLDKSYRATIQLGATSDTGDAEGSITKVDDRQPEIMEVKKVLAGFKGEITQIPPQYSAIKIGGVAAYKRARQGESVNMPSRQVTIHSLDLDEYSYPSLMITTSVSSGTYIRTLAEDIGVKLGTGGHITALRRLTIGEYGIDQALSLKELDRELLNSHLMKL